METKRQSHCWWFDSYNSSKCSRWLESTLSELNDKTKTMLKLIEEDADSFAQRAEMYYKKRPELISLVEDFYRAHRSLAERYDQLKSDRAARVRSPLRHSISLPKEEYEYVFDSVNSTKSFDSFTDVAYSSEDAAESEVDDPEQEDYAQTNQDEQEVGKPFADGGATYDELMKLREELDKLTEQNEILKNIIKQKEEEKQDLVKLLSDNISELRKLREDMGTVKEENLVAVMQESCGISVQFNEVKRLKEEIENLEVEVMYQKEQVKKKEELVIEVSNKFEEARYEIIKLEEEAQTKKTLAVKEEETAEVIEVTKAELEKLGDEMGRWEMHLKDACMGEDSMRHIKDAFTGKDWKKKDAIRELKDALAERDEEKNEIIRHLKNALAEKDVEKKEVIRVMTDALAEKDEEKREAIRQLSVAMEILREESKFLKKSLVNSCSPKKY